MITTALECPVGRATLGSSPFAEEIADEYADVNSRLQESIVLGLIGKGVFSELDAVFEECSVADWDGYGAFPIWRETYEYAREFLESLPWEIAAPTVGAEPDGHLTLEWYTSNRKTLSVSIAPDGYLHFSVLLGSRSFYGSEPIDDSSARNIAELVDKVVTP